MATLPHANNFEFKDKIIIDILTSTKCPYCGCNHQSENNSIPRLNYAEIYDKNRNIGLDNHLRQIAPIQYRNVMQATNEFMDHNSHILQRCKVTNPLSNRLVNGARLNNNCKIKSNTPIENNKDVPQTILHKNPKVIKSLIKDSNDDSMNNRNYYPLQMENALDCLYEFKDCNCNDDCYCKKCGCNGHWKLREDVPVTFSDLLPHFLKCFVNSSSHKIITDHLDNSVAFSKNTRGRASAYNILVEVKENWNQLFKIIKEFNNKTLICTAGGEPSFLKNVNLLKLINGINIKKGKENIYKSKLYSMLFIDLVIPFDTASSKKIRQDLGLSVNENYLDCLKQWHDGLIDHFDRNKVKLSEFRRYDNPKLTYKNSEFQEIHRPISRIIDKFYYTPKQKNQNLKYKI